MLPWRLISQRRSEISNLFLHCSSLKAFIQKSVCYGSSQWLLLGGGCRKLVRRCIPTWSTEDEVPEKMNESQPRPPLSWPTGLGWHDPKAVNVDL